MLANGKNISINSNANRLPKQGKNHINSLPHLSQILGSDASHFKEYIFLCFS